MTIKANWEMYMDIVKNAFDSAFHWVKSSPWRIAGLVLLVSLLICWIVMPIWDFFQLFGTLLMLGAFPLVYFSYKAKKTGNEKKSNILSVIMLVLIAGGLVSMFYGVSQEPSFKAELAQDKKNDAEKKIKEESEKKRKTGAVDKIVSVTNSKLSESLSDWSKDFANGNEKSAWTAFVNKISVDKDLGGVKITLTSEADILSPAMMYNVAKEAHAMSKRVINGVAHSDNKDFTTDDVYDFFGFSDEKDATYANPHAWLYRNDGTEVVHTSVVSNVFERDSFK